MTPHAKVKMDNHSLGDTFLMIKFEGTEDAFRSACASLRVEGDQGIRTFTGNVKGEEDGETVGILAISEV
jgi:hypothetical protein